MNERSLVNETVNLLNLSGLSTLQFSLLCILILVFHNEWLSFFLPTLLLWPKDLGSGWLKILIVSDPQLQVSHENLYHVNTNERIDI